MDSRLKQIRKQLGLRQEQMAEILDCRKENISMIERGKSSLSGRNKRCLVKKFNLNPRWLEGEEASMFTAAVEHAVRMEQAPELVPESIPLYDVAKIPSLAALFRSMDGGRSIKKSRVPGAVAGAVAGKGPDPESGAGANTGAGGVAGANLGAVAGTGEDKRAGATAGADANPDSVPDAFVPTGYISIPGLSGCDGALRVAGEGMSPVLRSGDVVIFRRQRNVTEIFWGEMYLLSVESSAGEYIAARYLRRPEKAGFALLAGENPEFGDTEIPLSSISALALVKASIRMNSTK